MNTAGLDRALAFESGGESRPALTAKGSQKNSASEIIIGLNFLERHNHILQKARELKWE
jgi:hypothetical protein